MTPPHRDAATGAPTASTCYQAESKLMQADVMDTRQIHANDPALADVLTLIRTAFSAMDGRIDPPSSMHRLTEATLARAARVGELWAIGAPPVASVLLEAREGALYLSKLAVAPGHRRQGLAARLMSLAETRARARGLGALELNTRVELTENHATFHALGFERIAETAHPGFDRPTSVLMRKAL